MASKPTQGWAFFLFFFYSFSSLVIQANVYAATELSWPQKAALILLLPHEVEEMH